MTTAAPSFSSANPPRRPLRVGFLALTDAAPFIVARELGLFTQHGLDVRLSREVGWATIREKVIYGELDAAHAPAPMLWSTALGIGCMPCDVLTGLVLSLHGNALTLSNRLRAAGVRDAATLRQVVRDRRRSSPVTLGVVFPFSSHHLLLRDWLRGGGIDPDREVRIVVVPPAQMFRNLHAGTIDGYCVGEPWNSYAVREGAGWCPTWSSAQQPGLAEKVLLVTRRFAEARPREHAALIAALSDACAWCEEARNRDQLGSLLAEARHLNLPADLITPPLHGKFDCGHGRIESVPDFHVFHRGEANVPSLARALAVQEALRTSGLLAPALIADPELPRRLFREDLHREALLQHPLHETNTSIDQRGVGC